MTCVRNVVQPLQMADQSQKTWLITGSTHGIGLETAKAAARVGARVILAVRDPERGQRIAHQLGDADVLTIDLADLSSVHRAAEELTEPVDILVNNAGTVSGVRRETVDGFELLLGTNALGPFAFTNLVLPRVRERVVIVGSGAHRWVDFDFQDPHFTRRQFSFRQGYGQSKLAGMLWGLGLSRRLHNRAQQSSARPVSVQLAHPGWSYTNLHNHTRWKKAAALVGVAATISGQSAADGAQNTLAAATWQLPECSYVGPDGRGELRGAPSLVGRSATASDPQIAEAFWDFAEQATDTYLSEL